MILSTKHDLFSFILFLVALSLLYMTGRLSEDTYLNSALSASVPIIATLLSIPIVRRYVSRCVFCITVVRVSFFWVELDAATFSCTVFCISWFVWLLLLLWDTQTVTTYHRWIDLHKLHFLIRFGFFFSWSLVVGCVPIDIEVRRSWRISNIRGLPAGNATS